MNNALTSSIKYATQELRDTFYLALGEQGGTISSVVNNLIATWLKEQGYKIDDRLTIPARAGRPLGSKNIVKRVKTVVEPPVKKEPHYFREPETAQTAKVSKALAVPSIVDIVLTIKTEKWGMFPVGAIRRLTPDEKHAIKLQVADNQLSSQMLDAEYLDETGRYFNKDWEFFINQTFMQTVAGDPAKFVEDAINNSEWFPSDPEDPRVTGYLKRALWGLYGYMHEGNGKALGLTFKEWEAEIKERGLNFNE